MDTTFDFHQAWLPWHYIYSFFKRIKFVDETFPTCRIINQWSRMKVGQCLKRVKAFVKIIPVWGKLPVMSGLMCARAVYLRLTGASVPWWSGFSALQVSFPASHLIDMLIKCVWISSGRHFWPCLPVNTLYWSIINQLRRQLHSAGRGLAQVSGFKVLLDSGNFTPWTP